MITRPCLNTRDNFWACLSYRLYQTETRTANVRSSLLLEFANLLFEPPSKNVAEFLSRSSASLLLKQRPYFFDTWHAEMDTELSTWPDEEIKDAAKFFVQTNIVEGKCLCHQTLLELYANVYYFTVHLLDENENPIVVISNQQKSYHYHVYIQRRTFGFVLMFPASSDFREADKYKLVKCSKEQVLDVDTFHSVGKLVHACSGKYKAGIYRILPTSPSKRTLDVPLTLFINGSPVLSTTKPNIPLAFLLDGESTLAISQTDNINEAIRSLAEELTTSTY